MGLRVLIVDDNPVTRVMLSEMLENLGHKAVAEAEGMTQAMEAYSKNKPDLVLLDLSLSDGDGLSTLKSIRQADPKARVLVISGNAQQKVKDDVLASGALAFINKPINFQEFSKILSGVTP